MIKYHKGDLFELAPPGSILAHSCNAQGVWGSGIAKQFKEKFPKSYISYNSQVKGNGFVGHWLLCDKENSHQILCLVTSEDYGKNVDHPITIIINTYEALFNFTNKYNEEIWMPRINSGLFNVPWEWTEQVLKQFDHITFNVVEYDNGENT